jgi:hypothetical protein
LAARLSVRAHVSNLPGCLLHPKRMQVSDMYHRVLLVSKSPNDATFDLARRFISNADRVSLLSTLLVKCFIAARQSEHFRQC